MSFETHIRRIIKSGMQHVWRNGTVTIASIFVTMVTLMVISLLLFTSAVLSFSLDQVAEKVDVNVYFYPNTPEETVIEVQHALEDLEEVKIVEYVSRGEALERFKARHSNDQLTLQALAELGENPLGAALNVRSHEPSEYEQIAEFLGPEKGGLSSVTQSMIEKVNYHQNVLIIERISRMMETVKRLGLVLALVFMGLAVIITVNTIRLAIYSSREEISVMQMVGARKNFVRGPFFVAGTFYGVVGAALTVVILYPLTLWIANQTTSFFGGLSIFDFYVTNFGWMVIILFAAGIVISVIATALAIRAYLRK